ncbi:hypothetical protein ACOME3_009493 [Neoechinorhynchus agilis]
MFIRCLPSVFCARSLEQLDKRHCNLTHVPDDVLRHQRTLEELFLDSNQLRDLPKSLFRATQLRRLTISDNEINRLPVDIGNLHLLQELDCSRNEIFDLPEEIRYCQNLQVLDASGNPLQNGLPSAITSLMNLSHLTLNDISLTQLPDNIGNLENLRCLEARENLLRLIPDSLCEIVRLITLDLGNNEIGKLPNSIGQLHNLRELWLDVNELTLIPEEIAHLKRLQCIDLSSNKLTVLTDQIGELTSLTSLELSQNRLKRIPETIGRLKSLTILKVDQNALETLPNSLGWCTSLSELIVTSNQLQELPENIGHLYALKHLNADKNNLKSLPNSICDCKQLGILSLRFNLVELLPDDLGNLSQLRVLDLTSNKLRYLPHSLLKVCCDHMETQSTASYSNQPEVSSQIKTTANLKAIWLSENQARPMLRLQEEVIEVDADYDEIKEKKRKKILTCYLLPQAQYSTPSIENLQSVNTSNHERAHNSHLIHPLQFVPAIAQSSDHPLLLRSVEPKNSPMLDIGVQERTGSVKFSVDVHHVSSNNQESSVSSRSATVLRRQNTPHPKEFKAWRRRDKTERPLNGGIDTTVDSSPTLQSKDEIFQCVVNSGQHAPDMSTSTFLNNKCTDRPITTRCKNGRIEDVVIEKPNRFAPLGLSIVGGSDQSSPTSFTFDNRILQSQAAAVQEPVHHEVQAHGIYIFKVQPNGLAFRYGLKAGDRILAVNDICIERATHQEAVKALMNITQTTLILKVQRSETLTDVIEVCVHRLSENEPLGIKLNGGLGCKNVCQ